MTDLIMVLSWACLITGGLAGISGAVGLLRFPDFYARLHAASVTDTLCTGLIIVGLILQGGGWMMAGKLLLIMFVLAYTGPTAAHLLAKTAIKAGKQPRAEQYKGEGK